MSENVVYNLVMAAWLLVVLTYLICIVVYERLRKTEMPRWTNWLLLAFFVLMVIGLMVSDPVQVCETNCPDPITMPDMW